MRSAARERALPHINTLAIDNDGALRPDVRELARQKGFLREENGPLRKLFLESIFLGMHISFKAAAKALPETPIDGKVPEVMRYAQGRGLEVKVCTANPLVDTGKIKEELKAYGLDIDVSSISNRKKAKLYGKGTILVEDDPLVAIRAARRGAEVVLMLDVYNPYLSLIFSTINERIHVVANWHEAAGVVSELIDKSRYSPMIREKSSVGVGQAPAEA